MRKGLLCFLAVIILAMAPCRAGAEDRKAAPEQPVASSGEVQKEKYELSGITVSATKTTVPADLSPVTTYTVDRKSIDSQPDHFRENFGQLIQDLPGVVVGQPPNKSPVWINLRGTGDFSARTLHLVDGVPVGSSITLTNSIYNYDVERVDVVMGPSSALYGANASGGVVNIITRQGTPGMGATVSYSYGSHNTNRPHVSVGDLVSKGDNKFHYYFSYSGDYSDGFKNIPVDNALRIYRKSPSFLTTATLDDAAYRSTYLAGKVGWIGSGGASLTAAYNFVDQTIRGGQPSLIHIDDGMIGLGHVRFQLPYSDIGKLTFTGAYQSWDRPTKTNYGISLSGSRLIYNWQRKYAQESAVRRTPLELQNDLYLGKDNVLTTGVFFTKERISSESDNWVTDAFVSASSYSQIQEAAYIQDQAFFFDKRLSVLAGARYDSWKYYDIYDSGSTNKNPPGSHDDTVNYRAGVKYHINDKLAIKTSGGTAYYPGLPTWFFQNVNTGSTWREPNPDLKPERTWMVDLGLEGKLPSATSFSVTGYYGRIKDMVSGRYDAHPTLPGVSIIRYSNVGEAEIYGVETLVSQSFGDSLSAFLNLTFNRSTIVDDPVNKDHQLANAPSFTGSIGGTYKNPRLFDATLIVRAANSQFYDNENTRIPFYHTDPYCSVDAKVWRDWKLTEKTVLRTAISAENLLDRDYSSEFIYSNPGRFIEGRVTFNYAF